MFRRSRWTLQLIAERFVELKVVDSISATAVGTTLKNEIKPWLYEEWRIPKASAEFVADMEDILEVYQRPYGPARPVVCLDETSRQLIEETRVPLPALPGKTAKMDSEYRRNGVADLFMLFEPLAGVRYVEGTDSRKREDFALCV